jgi:hypothetical protein
MGRYASSMRVMRRHIQYNLKTEGKRLTGRPICRWKDNVKINLKEADGGLGAVRMCQHARARTHTHHLS